MATDERKQTTEERVEELRQRCELLPPGDALQVRHLQGPYALRRFVRAFTTTDAAYTALTKCRAWRVKYGVEELTSKHPDVQTEAATGKATILDFKDFTGRPIVYIAARKHTAYDRDIDRLTRFIVYTLETACARCCDEVADNLCIAFDLKDFSMSNMDYQFIKNLIWLLSKYYPERLGACLILNAPMLFYGCWAVIRPWLNDVTASKVTFVTSTQQLSEYMPPDLLPQD